MMTWVCIGIASLILIILSIGGCFAIVSASAAAAIHKIAIPVGIVLMILFIIIAVTKKKKKEEEK